MGASISGASNFGGTTFGASNFGNDGFFGGARIGSSSSSSSADDPPLNDLNAANPPRPSTTGIAPSSAPGGPLDASFASIFTLLFFSPLFTIAFAAFEFPPLLVAISYASSAFAVPRGVAVAVPVAAASSSARAAFRFPPCSAIAATPIAARRPIVFSRSSRASALARVLARPRARVVSPSLFFSPIVVALARARVAVAPRAVVIAIFARFVARALCVRVARARRRRVRRG